MAFTLTKRSMNRKDMVVMLTTLSWMLDAGVSLGEGVKELLSDPNNKLNKSGMEIIGEGLNDGKVLSQIFRENEDVFGQGRWRQVDAAERTGKIAECLRRLADQIQNDGDLMGKVRNAIIYPALILILALVAGYYMFTTIVPQMGDMLLEFGVELPPLTKAVMSLSNFMINHLVILVGIIVGCVIFIVYLLKKPLHFPWNRLITRIPFVGSVSVNMNYSIVYVLLDDMISNGAHLVEALRVASGSATNVFIQSEIQAAADYMEREGAGLTEALTTATTMPPDDKLMLQVGSRSGREIELLEMLSKRRKAEAYASVNSLMEVLPTVVLLLVATVVGVMVVSIYMPMISMATDLA